MLKDDIIKIKEAAGEGEFQSLVLFGAYGKDEGYLVDDRPSNDLDILVVDGNKQTISRLRSLRASLPLDILAVSQADLKDITPTQMWWEIKYGSKLLSGWDLELPNWNPWDIPYWDAIMSLDRRCLSMILGKYELMQDKPDYRKVTEQICKMVIALGDAVLIKRGQFHHLLARRSLMLCQDEINSTYQLAVSMKVTGWPEMNPDQLWHLWHETSKRFRNYVTINQLNVPKADALLSITDRTTAEELKEMFTGLGGEEKWLK